MLHQLCVSLRAGDAISNQAAAIHRIATAQRIPAQAWHLHAGRHPQLASQPFQQCRPQPQDILLLHYSTASELDDFVRAHAAQSILCYHNITPPEFYAPFNPTLAAQLRLGRERLQTHFFGDALRLCAGTAFNQAELRAWGYPNQRIAHVPYVVSPERVQQGATSASGQRLSAQIRAQGQTHWLYVGRIAPNKRQDSLVRAFAHYRQHYDPHAKLWLIGSSHSAGSYLRYVQAHISALGLQAHVQLLSPSDEALGAYYAAADVYVSLSEHEGFGVPLLEAMWMGVPIIALARTAVVETMGQAGLRLESNAPELVAACAHVLQTQPALRQQTIAAQRQQAERYAPAQTEAQVADWLRQVFDYNHEHA